MSPMKITVKTGAPKTATSGNSVHDETQGNTSKLNTGLCFKAPGVREDGGRDPRTPGQRQW